MMRMTAATLIMFVHELRLFDAGSPEAVAEGTSNGKNTKIKIVVTIATTITNLITTIGKDNNNNNNNNIQIVITITTNIINLITTIDNEQRIIATIAANMTLITTTMPTAKPPTTASNGGHFSNPSMCFLC